MMNYIKSEFYRVSRSKNMYIFTGILVLLSLLLNLTLWWFRRIDSGVFLYGSTSFSFSNLVANPMIFPIIAAIITVFLYEKNLKNGNLKNTIAFGVSRIKIFTGKCIVATAVATSSLVVVLGTYIISALLLLENSGPTQLADLLTEIPAILFIAVASIISVLVCIEVSGKESTGLAIWFLIWILIPKIFFYLGLRLEISHMIAMWFPVNFFSPSEMPVNLTQSVPVWGTFGGMVKCVVVGLIGTAFFYLSGLSLLKKKEV